MTKKSDVQDDLFNEENIPESNWFKFEKIGDRVSGEVVEIFEKPGKDMYPAQRCFTLKQKTGELINVGVKKTSDYLMGRTNRVKAGDMLGFEFKKEVPSTTKGYAPAKSIEVYIKEGEPKIEDATRNSIVYS